MIKKFGLPILTLFGIGYFKYAPGTAASFITCLIYFTLTESAFSLGINKFHIVVFLIFVLFYSIIFIDKLSPVFKKKDPREIVIDEFVGQCIPLVSILFRTDGFIPNCCIIFRVKNKEYWVSLDFLVVGKFWTRLFSYSKMVLVEDQFMVRDFCFNFLYCSKFNFLRSRYLFISTLRTEIFNKGAISLEDKLSLKYAQSFKSLGVNFKCLLLIFFRKSLSVLLKA